MATNKFLTGCGLMVALAGCGGVSGIPIEKTADDFSQTICSAAYRCCSPETLMGNSAAGMSESECETKTAANFRGQLQNMQNSDTAGRSKYDQMQVDKCLASLRAAECSELTSIRSLSQVPDCGGTFATPLVAAGGKCQNDFECIAGVCQKPMNASEGVCVAGNTTGGACNATDNRCAPNLTCDPRDGNNATDDVCVVEQDVGGACVDNFDCKMRNCAADATSGAKTCQAPTAPQCFYGGGCSAAGGRPGAGALLVIGLFAAVALMRSRRTRRSRTE